MKVEIYSDVVCPWCYIGERRFERALAQFAGRDDVEIEFRPYQLDPRMPERAVPLREYLRGRFGGSPEPMIRSVSDAAEGVGIRIEWDRALAVSTRTAHRLLRLALLEYGPDAQRALVDQLFEAHFTQGGDVSDHAQLTEVAVAAGMDRERVQRYLASDEGARELEAEFDVARRLGVSAVPTFVFDGQYAVSGAQPPAVFLQVLDEVARRSRAA